MNSSSLLEIHHTDLVHFSLEIRSRIVCYEAEADLLSLPPTQTLPILAAELLSRLVFSLCPH